MNYTEEKITNSFRLAKNDIMKLQDKITELSQTQERIMEFINKVKHKEDNFYQKVNKLQAEAQKPKTIRVVGKRVKKIIVASKTGKNIHEPNCPFAKNIKPKSLVVFHSKNSALNAGYKACECMKSI
ncbi:hypothetical protein ISS05_02105 [Candidatus Woesearchaeota archaeon]|nr:hypothetical protein [Candidatus Woesearchaeota archaeon]